MKQTPEQLFEQLSKEFAPKKEKEVINEELGKVVELKPIAKLEPTTKEPFWTKFESFLAENSLEPIVNNDMKFNTKEGDEKIKSNESKFSMDDKLAGSYKVSSEVENIASHNYDYSPSVDNINNVNAQEVLTGIQCEINYNKELTLDEAKELAVKNLAKDPLHYVKEGQFGVKGLGYTEQKMEESEGETYGGSGFSEKVKESDNALQVVKEDKDCCPKEQINEELGQVVTTGNPFSLAAMSGQVIKDLMAEKEEKALPMDENLSSAEQEKVMSALNDYVKRFKPDFGKVSEIADMLSELTGISSNKIQSHLMQLTGGDDEMIFEDARTDAEEEGYEDGFKDAKKDMKDALSKMKVSELKAKIKEDIIEILSEQDEEVDVDVEDEVKADVDVDVEDDVAVDAQGDDINIKKKSVKADIEVGLSPVEELVQDSLEAAMKASEQLGNQTLTDQIGNTITYFTREFVVGRNTD